VKMSWIVKTYFPKAPSYNFRIYVWVQNPSNFVLIIEFAIAVSVKGRIATGNSCIGGLKSGDYLV
jgi:hypothetical protein